MRKMKNNIAFACILPVALFVISSCNKNDNKMFVNEYSFKTSGSFVITTRSQDIPIDSTTTIHLNGFIKNIDVPNQIGNLTIAEKEDELTCIKNVLFGDQYVYGASAQDETIKFNQVLLHHKSIGINDIDMYYNYNGQSVKISTASISISVYSHGVGKFVGDDLVIEENYSGSLAATIMADTPIGMLSVPFDIATITDSDIVTIAKKSDK